MFILKLSSSQATVPSSSIHKAASPRTVFINTPKQKVIPNESLRVVVQEVEKPAFATYGSGNTNPTTNDQALSTHNVKSGGKVTNQIQYR